MDTNERVIDKAKEAFVMAIEIYIKSSVKYRLEGFSFFMCNAWEEGCKPYKNGENSGHKFCLPRK